MLKEEKSYNQCPRVTFLLCVCVCVCVVLFDVLLVGCPPIYGGAHKISVAGRGDTEVCSNLVVTPRKNKLVRELAGFRAWWVGGVDWAAAVGAWSLLKRSEWKERIVLEENLMTIYLPSMLGIKGICHGAWYIGKMYIVQEIGIFYLQKKSE